MKTPVKIRTRRALLGFFLLAVVYLVLDATGRLAGYERVTLDYRYAHINRPTKPSAEVVVIDIDEQSLKVLSPFYGRWPWPRRLYKDLVEFIGIGEPRVVLFDLLFSEKQLGAKDDALLGDVSAAQGRVSHAMNLLVDRAEEGGDSLELPADVVQRFALSGFPPEASYPKLTDYHDFVLPNPDLLARIPGLHVVTFEEDVDGVARRCPLLFRYGRHWLPSLALKGLLAGMKEPRFEYVNNELFVKDATHRYRLPAEADGTFPIHYYRRGNVPTVIPIASVISSAIAVQRGSEEALQSLKVSPDEFKDKIVIVGTSAVGLADLKSTPVQTLFPGSLVQATAISNLLQGDFLDVPALGWRTIFTWFFLTGLYAILFLLPSVGLRAAFSVCWIGLFAVAIGAAFYYRGVGLPAFGPACFGALAIFDGLYFNFLVEWLERRKLQGTFSKYLAPAVIEQIIARGENPHAEIGKHEELSILFADLKGFTSISETASPELIVERLNEYLGRMTDVIFDHRGTLDKFIGDAIMAFWGAPLANPQHALDAVRCAMAMHQGVKKMGELWAASHRNQLPFEARIGINTGQVIVGNIGSEKHLNYTVIGDNVNLASRMEGLTRYYEVPTLIGARTEELVREHIVCRLVELQVRVKGKAKHAKLFEPVCEASDAKADLERAFARRFEEGLQLYSEGKFEWARRLFGELNTERSGTDGPCRLYLERCAELIARPPENWDGVYVAKSK